MDNFHILSRNWRMNWGLTTSSIKFVCPFRRQHKSTIYLSSITTKRDASNNFAITGNTSNKRTDNHTKTAQTKKILLGCLLIITELMISLTTHRANCGNLWLLPLMRTGILRRATSVGSNLPKQQMWHCRVSITAWALHSSSPRPCLIFSMTIGSSSPWAPYGGHTDTGAVQRMLPVLLSTPVITFLGFRRFLWENKIDTFFAWIIEKPIKIYNMILQL